MNKTLPRFFLTAALLAFFSLSLASAQQSVARRWNELCLQAIRIDFARPPVQARNLFHLSVVMYDAWAAYDTVAQPFFLGKTWGTTTNTFAGVPKPADVEAARREAISYAAYRLLRERFRFSPGAVSALASFDAYMVELGYSTSQISMNYASGMPSALGNYIASSTLNFGVNDGSNEVGNYLPTHYLPVNPPMNPALVGNPTILDPNRWQPLNIATAVDQNGNPIPSIQRFQSPEWGRVAPFAMTNANCDTFYRNNIPYNVYHNPGAPPQLDTTANGDPSAEYKWNYALPSVWSAHLDPTDGVMWDISPASIGNNQTALPKTLAEYESFYKLFDGGAAGNGRPLNPSTGLPYAPQVVPRGDYTRVLAQFWADGPNSETPPGHWFSIFNHVMDHPMFVRKFNGKGDVLPALEYDVKAYFTLGGSLHDAAISAWGIKGWYDSGRPVNILRYMADKGQSSDPAQPHYHPAGVPLMPGYIELVKAGDPLAGSSGGHINKIKVKAWRGPNAVANPATDIAGVGWILAENWWPYQRKTFVTPPFAGFISGHSTYSRSAAEALTLLTGDEYFPGGVGEFKIAANSGFLGVEKGPSVDVTLQWATYRDASDQTSLSRIWGGIHPPVDDIPGRVVGIKCGTAAYNLAKTLFFKDSDADGFVSIEDCDDSNETIYPGAPELCDGLDNNCNGLIDDDTPVYTYYFDADGDGFAGISPDSLSTCADTPPTGYVANQLDCDDANPAIHSNAPELCDGLDNDCNGSEDDAIPVYTYYFDADGDGFAGLSPDSLSTCADTPPAGYVANQLDCDDANAAIRPNAVELCDGVDNDCNGLMDDGIPFFIYYADVDGDSFGGMFGDTLFICADVPPVGFVANRLDCDDANAAIYPDAPELCDGLDNNCNGLMDDGIPFFTYFADADGDGFGGVAADTVSTCIAVPPTGFVTNRTDCDDADATAYPGAAEVCDGADNDCNGLEDDGVPFFTYYLDGDGDGFGGDFDSLFTCLVLPPMSPYVPNQLDCDDSNAAIHPNAPELCDGLDNNCNGLMDDGLPIYTYFFDADSDGYGGIGGDTINTCATTPPLDFVTNRLDCDDTNSGIRPDLPEICDDVDNNCNGLVDDGIPFYTYYIDWDKDGFGTALFDSTYSCQIFPPGTPLATNSLDCDDINPAINPNALEVPDGLDNDCNGLVDDISAVHTPALPISAYPNPVEGELVLRADIQGLVRAELFDTGGRLLRSEEVLFENGLATVDFTRSLPGVYVLKLQATQRGQTWVLRVVKL